MDERKLCDKGYLSRSRPTASCSLPIIRPRTAAKRIRVYVPRYIKRKLFADQPHRTNDASLPRKQHPRCDMDSFVGETLLHRPTEHSTRVVRSEGELLITAMMCSNSMLTAGSQD